MRERTDDAWFTNWRNAADQVGQITLVCLPHAGAGASVYARWAALLPPWIDLVGITLPGRESRISEPPLTSMDEVISRLGPAVSARVQEPFALFGHSLGALIGYELACWLGTALVGAPASTNSTTMLSSPPCTSGTAGSRRLFWATSNCEKSSSPHYGVTCRSSNATGSGVVFPQERICSFWGHRTTRPPPPPSCTPGAS